MLDAETHSSIRAVCSLLGCAPGAEVCMLAWRVQVYLDHIDEIRSEESTINLDFLHIDQQPIKAVRSCHSRTRTACRLVPARC
jgi:hypothetical protein